MRIYMAMDRKSIRRWAYVALAAVVFAVAAFLAANAIHAYLYGRPIAGSIARPLPSAAPALQAESAAFDQALAIAGFVMLVIALGWRLLGVTLALIAVIATYQLLGGDYTYIAYAMAIGLALASVNARPLIRMPRSFAMLMAVIGAVLVAFGDVTLIGAGILYAGYIIALLLLQGIAAMGDAGILAVVGWIIAMTWIGRAVASARGVAGVALSFAAGFLGLLVGLYLLQFLLQAALIGVGVVALIIASIVAIIDLFQALERGRPEALVWAGPLAILASIWGINLAPILGGVAGISAIVAAFTLSDRYANTAIILALAALVLAGAGGG
jgi:hypothetical protein